MPQYPTIQSYEAVAKHNKSLIRSTRILAEGDSWFKYPRRYWIAGSNSNVIDWLAAREDFDILNEASNGDELLSMMSGRQKVEALEMVDHYGRRGNPFDYVLLSGGGNDIVGPYDFPALVRKNEAGTKAEDFVNGEALDRRLRMLTDGYIDFADRIFNTRGGDKLKIVTHEYDFAFPMLLGFRLFDRFGNSKGWMMRYMDPIIDSKYHHDIIKYILSAFAKSLKKVEAKFDKRFIVVSTQGTFADASNNDMSAERKFWRNEIHPTPKGFQLIAQKFERVMIPTDAPLRTNDPAVEAALL